MKHFILVVVLFFNVDAFSATLQDSSDIDFEQTEKIIKSLKKELEPHKYFLSEGNNKEEDILYTYPNKVIKEKYFNIIIKYQGEMIFSYEVNSASYKLTGKVLDFRK